MIKITISTFMVSVGFLISPAQAQVVRDGVVGFYGGLGAIGGSGYGPGGTAAGGTVGAMVGGWIYDTHKRAFDDFRRNGAQYQRVYPSRQFRTYQSTPAYRRPRW